MHGERERGEEQWQADEECDDFKPFITLKS